MENTKTNTGEKIQLIGTILIIVGIIFSIIGAIAIGNATTFWGFAITLIVGIFGSVVSGLVLIGFGELIESNNRINYKMDNIINKIDEIKRETMTVAKRPIQIQIPQASQSPQENQPSQEAQAFSQSQISKEEPKEPQMWKCPQCGNFNFDTSNICMNCHTKFELMKDN